MDARAHDPVTIIVTRQVKRGREADYEAWLARLIDATRTLPGYLGATIHRPTGDAREYTCVYRFDSVDHLRGFEDSEARRRALAEIGDFVEADAVLRTMTGLEVWFEPPAGAATPRPTRWRMAVLMMVVIYALVLILGRLVSLALPGARFEVRLAVTIVVEVSLMTYLVMPTLTRWLARWIYPA